MKIKAIKLYENGFMSEPFAFGGEEGTERFNANVKFRSSLQNYLIDTGDEVILVDTGMPSETPDDAPNETLSIYMGTRIKDYVSSLEDLGYKKEQITKILVTHKHNDHTGELRSFPNAKIYISREEADKMNLQGENIIRVDFKDGKYKNFEKSEKILDNIYFIEAKGHTTGNSIVIVENDGLYYMIHGDVTYTDEALYENKLSVVFEDKELARDTLNKVREFIRNNPTVYLSTHTPLGYENLENKKVIDLDNKPESIKPQDIFTSADIKEDINKAIEKITHGMYVLTTKNGGCIVDAVCQISAGDNPLISVAVNKKNYTNELLHTNQRFAISIIGMKTDKEVIDTYGFHSMRDYNKFSNSKTEIVDGLNIVSDSVGYIICDKIDMIENDTHTLFIGKITNGKKLNEDQEITYNYYREHKDELLKVKTENNQTAWICLTCGYVYYGDELPEDFTCPQCGVGKEMFQKKF